MSKNDWKLIVGGGGWNKDVVGVKKSKNQQSGGTIIRDSRVSI